MPMPVRSMAAMVSNSLLNLHRPGDVMRFAKAMARYPVEYSASRAHARIPIASLLDLFPEAAGLSVSAPPDSLGRHGWNVKLHEELYLGLIVAATRARTIFEIGTFDGGTTRRLAESSIPEAVVHTIDLPEEMFDATQSPTAFKGSQVGEKYRDSPAAAKIRQFRHDASTFDFSEYIGRMDFVFVDAAHDYEHGLVDSATALKLVAPGGTIVWHDFEPYWSGLVHAICRATANKPLRRLGGTSMAVLRNNG